MDEHRSNEEPKNLRKSSPKQAFFTQFDEFFYFFKENGYSID